MRCHSTWGKIFFAIAAFFCICALLTLFEINTDPNWPDATLGLLMFATIAGIPGFVLCHRANKRYRALNNRILGFVQSRDSFSIAELAKATELDESAARAKILELLKLQTVDLVFDADTSRYIQRSKASALKTVERCDSCGSKIAVSKTAKHQLVDCPYCGGALRN